MNARPILRLLLLFLLVLVPVISGYAQDGNPRHPGVARFEEIGSYPAGTIWPLGDVSGDGIADIAIERFLDTGISPGRKAQELLILHGAAGRLPQYDTAKRLEPGQLLSKSLLLAVGDWDGLNGPDLCVYTILYRDTAFGNADLLYDGTGVVMIYWNDGAGHYALADTSRLFTDMPGSFTMTYGTSGDWDQDGVEDLYLHGPGTIRRYAGVEKIPKGFIYRGHKEQRWGHGGVPNTPDWHWWNAPTIARAGAEDLDQDDAADLILYSSDHSTIRPLTVFYGRQDGALPDTLQDVQQINMVSVGGWATNFSDVSGDGVADLTVLNSSQSLVYIYIGCKGQRLLEQFGTGNDPPEGERWWGRPWASVKGPNFVSDAWFGLGYQLFDLGSADSNKTEEIWVQSSDFLICYDVGGRLLDGIQYGLDSLFDGQVYPWGDDAKRLGDIDADGRAEFSVNDDGELRIYRMVYALPEPMLSFWRVPQGCGVSSAADDKFPAESELSLRAIPNPARGDVRVFWTAERETGEAVITVHDMLGQEVTTMRVPAWRGEAVWDAAKTFGGRYFITVTLGRRSETAEVVIQR